MFVIKIVSFHASKFWLVNYQIGELGKVGEVEVCFR